jgi:hypothetical protein
MIRVARAGLACWVIVAAVVTGCVADPTPPAASSPPPTPSATPETTPGPSATAEASATEAPSPTATAEPPLSLDLPGETDARVVTVSVDPQVGDDGGQILVTVTSQADERIDELVLRWPTELEETLFLAPFVPSADRIREGGPPLVQQWTKWVVGPGEHGEPEGTTSLGYGPLLAGATLEIPIFVTRTAPGPVAFDLQVLARNDLLTLDGGEPAELRVEIP